MKIMNWGNGLVLVFTAFVALIGTLVYKSMNTKFELVTKDYYKEELRYQTKIDGKKNAATLTDIKIEADDKYIQIYMPEEQKQNILTGEVWLYCTTDATKDVKLPLQTTQHVVLIDRNKVMPGKYEAKISWQVNNKHFYAEKTLTLQ
jgi:hypothetical protein